MESRSGSPGRTVRRSLKFSLWKPIPPATRTMPFGSKVAVCQARCGAGPACEPPDDPARRGVEAEERITLCCILVRVASVRWWSTARAAGESPKQPSVSAMRMAELLCFWIESADSWFFLSFSPLRRFVIRGFGRGEELSGADILRLIRIRLSAFDWFAASVVNQEKKPSEIPRCLLERMQKKRSESAANFRSSPNSVERGYGWRRPAGRLQS